MDMALTGYFLIILCCGCLSPCWGLNCWASNCPNGESWCSITCADNFVCIGNYARTATSLEPLFFSCVEHLPTSDSDCMNTRCDLSPNGPFNALSCCCSVDYCNVVDGIVQGITGPPDGMVPTPAGTPPPATTSVCEVFELGVEHIYKECTYCFTEYKFIEADQDYALERKECMDTEYPGGCDSACVLDTTGTDPSISCCCEGYLCNEFSMLQFTDINRVSQYVQPSLCDTTNCPHSCVVFTNSTHSTPECFCNEGYLLRNDGSCIDIDECEMNPCPEICINTEGSFECSCPVGFFQQPNGSCTDEGLVCFDSESGMLDFCDRKREEQMITGPSHCLAIYRQRPGETDFFLQHLSCFYDPMCEGREGSECVLEFDDRSNEGIYDYLCCCGTNLCNTNVTFPEDIFNTTRPMISTETTVTVSTVSGGQVAIVSASVIVVVIIVVVIVVLAIVLRCLLRKKDVDLQTLPYVEDTDDEVELIPLNDEQIVLHEKIGAGRFAEVYRATNDTTEVAVKCFTSQDMMRRELKIFGLRNFAHQNILRYHHFHDEMAEKKFWIVFDFHKLGSVYDVIVQRILTLSELIKLAESTATGVSYLHSDMSTDGSKKHRVIHRDLKTKNILVKANGEACISDFGLSKTASIGEEHEAPCQVGTHRYMAPELLEGRIEFNTDSYRFIDCYALGIIFSEMLQRTKFNDEEPLPYSAPLSDFVPPNPTFDDIRIAVVTKNQRPTIPDRFIKSYDMDPLVNIVTELWDDTPSARISATLAKDKLAEFRVKQFDSGSSEVSTQSPSTPNLASPPPFNSTPSISFTASNYTTETTV